MSPLKDRDRSRPRRLVRLGVIRLGFKIFKCSNQQCDQRIRDTGETTIECPNCGQKNRSRRPYPTQADHFVLTDAPEIAKVYGDEPRELDVILPFPDIERNFDASYTVWAGGVLVCKGDGEFVDLATPYEVKKRKRNNKTYTTFSSAPGDTLVVNGEAQVAFNWNGEEFQPGDHVPCPGADADLYPHCQACKVSAILKVMMARPDLFRLGYYQIATGSGRNYDTILGTLELIHSQAGRVNGIPFKLRLVEEPTTYFEANGQRRQTNKWFLQLEPDPDFTRKLYRQQAAQILEAGAPVPRLAAPAEEFDEYDPEAPPPVASEVIDAEAGEIVPEDEDAGMSDNGSEPVEAEDVMVKSEKSGKMVRLGDLTTEDLVFIVDHPSKFDAEQFEAAKAIVTARNGDDEEEDEA